MGERVMALGDLGAAMALLTRLPLPPGAAHGRGARAAWAYPVVGGFVGALAGLVGWAALAAGLPAATAAGMVLAAQVLLTGGLHEDGLADLADGIGGGATRERRLAIMRDSRIGSYGALALILSLGLRGSLLAALLPVAPLAAPLAAGALSRAGMAGVMAALPAARRDGLSAATGHPGGATATLGGAAAMVLAALAAGPAAAFAAALAVAVAAAAGAVLSHAKLGGQTGDALGAAQQAGEVAALAALAITL